MQYHCTVRGHWRLARYVFGVSAFPAEEPAAERRPAAGTNPLWIFWDSRKQPIRMCWCSPGMDKVIASIEDRFPYPWFIPCCSSAGKSLLRKSFLRSDVIPLWDYSSVGLRPPCVSSASAPRDWRSNSAQIVLRFIKVQHDKLLPGHFSLQKAQWKAVLGEVTGVWKVSNP